MPNDGMEWLQTAIGAEPSPKRRAIDGAKPDSPADPGWDIESARRQLQQLKLEQNEYERRQEDLFTGGPSSSSKDPVQTDERKRYADGTQTRLEHVSEVNDEDAIRALKGQHLAESTKSEYKKKVKFYLDWCVLKNKIPFHANGKPNETTLGIFLGAGLTKGMGVASLRSAIREEGRQRSTAITSNVKIVKKQNAAQAPGCNIANLQRLASAASTPEEEDIVLSCAFEFLACQRHSTLSAMKSSDITFDKSMDSVFVAVNKVKNHVDYKDATTTVPIQFERLETPLTATTRSGIEISFCMHQVCEMMIDRASSTRMMNQTNYEQLHRGLKALCEKAHNIEWGPVPSDKRHYTTHSFRVGGICTLIRSGLSPSIITSLALWRDQNQILKYATVANLQPGSYQPYRFFNPRGHEANYTRLLAPTAVVHPQGNPVNNA